MDFFVGLGIHLVDALFCDQEYVGEAFIDKNMLQFYIYSLSTMLKLVMVNAPHFLHIPKYYLFPSHADQNRPFLIQYQVLHSLLMLLNLPFYHPVVYVPKSDRSVIQTHSQCALVHLANAIYHSTRLFRLFLFNSRPWINCSDFLIIPPHNQLSFTFGDGP